mgnify:CR=1 FL=1
MRRSLPALVLISAVVVHGQPAASSPPAPTRAVSPAVAAMLKAALPPVAPAPPATGPKAAKRAPGLRETDKPQNDIVRLPAYIVQEARPPVFREQDIYTPRALSRRLAKRYYPEWYRAFTRLVGFTPLALLRPSAEASAMAQFAEDERLRNKAEFSEYANWLKTSDPSAGTAFKSEVQQTFMHWSDLGWSNKSR